MSDVAVYEVEQEAEPAPVGSNPAGLQASLEPYRAELVRYCRRRLSSASDAEDAAQETLLRAWRAIDRFEGRAKLRSWLYCIATNVCADMLNARLRRTDLAAVMSSDRTLRPAHAWTGMSPSDRTEPVEAGLANEDPAEEAVKRDMVRLALEALVHLLPPRQRAVLILRDVLCWRADEVAELLGLTVAAVNSALQRARATLAARRQDDGTT